MPFQSKHQAAALWTLSAGMILLAVASSAYNPVTDQFAWHGDLPELHWKVPFGETTREHPATFISLVRDSLTAALLAGLCAWFAQRRNTARPHWLGAILAFVLMANNIRLAFRELQLIGQDSFGDYPYLWYLCVFHWLAGLLALCCLMPLMLHLRRRQNWD